LFGSFPVFLPLSAEPVAHDPKSDDDLQTSAADDPTAMWDEDSLKDLGLDDIAERHSSRPPGPKPVAAAPVAAAVAPANRLGHSTDPRVGPMVRRRPPPKRSGGMSWTLTIALAVALGTAVYYFVRLLKG
jgi:hypothetical protein